MNTIEIILASTILITLVWVRQEVISIKARKSKKSKKSKKTDAKRARALQQIVWNRETTIRMQNSQIQGLNGDIAKLKYDYAREVADTEVSEEINEQGTHVEPTKVCGTCGGRGKYRKAYDRHLSECEECGGTDENKTE